MLAGKDISKWNPGFSNWNYDFYFIRSSYGANGVDPLWVSFWNQCPKPKGFYHFAYPAYNSPKAEADNFSRQADRANVITQPLALDYEIATWSRNWAEDFIGTMKDRFPHSPVGTYSNISGFFYLGGPPIGDFTWLAHPQDAGGPTKYPCDILQYAIVGGVDTNVIRGKNPFAVQSEEPGEPMALLTYPEYPVRWETMPVVGLGARDDKYIGSYVHNIQTILYSRKYLKGDYWKSVDGFYGPKTAAAVKAFQKRHVNDYVDGLVPDGEVDVRTWHRLIRH
jgi:hypothetical protein